MLQVTYALNANKGTWKRTTVSPQGGDDAQSGIQSVSLIHSECSSPTGWWRIRYRLDDGKSLIQSELTKGLIPYEG